MGAPYTLILMDCQMPDMDGFETTRALRALEQADGRRVPIVAITANVMPGAREACLAAGMDDYLSKPVRLNMLQRVLARWHALPDAVAMRTDARRDVSAMAPLVTWDPATLENFRAMETAETAGATDQLLETFMAETGAQLEKMEAGLRDKDFESLRRAAHSIKGAAASLGAYELTARAAKIEELVKNQSDQGLAELLPDLRDEFERVKAALKMELQRKTR
jgi:Response regulators consisting of a CheY-like receiver domain and a winged-helix DNA-binding domain